MNDNITIYMNEACPYCKQIKEHFKLQNIDFVEKLTDKNTDEWQEISNITGLPSVPTIVYKDEYFVPGRDFFNPQQLIERIKNFKKIKASKQKQILEKIKTLNYNMSTAFSRTDQILRQIEGKLNNEQND